MQLFKHLNWDSSFFGFPVASLVHSENINIESILSSLKEGGYKLVYVFVPQAGPLPEKSILERYGGLLVDQKVTYRYAFPKEQNFISCPQIKLNEFSKVNGALAELAVRSGVYSRFNIDPDFDKNLFRNMYLEWIKNSVSGEIADYVITYHQMKEPEGLVTLKINGDTGKIGLICVSEAAQGKGIGTVLLNEVFIICSRMKIKNLEVISQERNIPACRLYEKNGFIRNDLKFVYHFWLRKNDTL
jgi:dTDP-4-amino-4,6-dideoxy-D-galactose acyltransferase